MIKFACPHCGREIEFRECIYSLDCCKYCVETVRKKLQKFLESKGRNNTIADKLYFSRAEIAQMLGVSERKIINVTIKHKIKPRMRTYTSSGGGRKNLYSLEAVEKIRRVIEKQERYEGGGKT